MTIIAALASWMASGRMRIGEVLIVAHTGSFELTHGEDAMSPALEEFTGADAALAIAKYDDAGKYRPLKTAPNLRHGWKLIVPDLPALRLALDYLYPGMVGTFVAHRNREIVAVNFRETANRQTGMYEIVQRIRDEAVDALIGCFCRSDGGCLKTILWQIDTAVPVTTLPKMKFDPLVAQVRNEDGYAPPLLCTEACNLLVAAARKAVRAAEKKA